MTSAQQRAELQRRIWQIANDVRGSIDGWDFKQYVLGALFYRFISENFCTYIEAGDTSVNYAANDCNLAASSYVEARGTREQTDITALNASLKTTVANINHLRCDIDAIVAEIEAN